jgi:serine protease
MKLLRSLRPGALAAALVMAALPLSATTTSSPVLAWSAPFFGAGKLDQKFDRFIVVYKDGSTERSSSAAALQNVAAAVSRAGLDRATKTSGGTELAPLAVHYKRKLATGADLLRTSRKLSQAEASALMAQIAADPAVVHVQPDYKMYAVKDLASPASVQTAGFTPDDPYYAKYQWHFSHPIGGANVDNAWDLADGSGITVAVLDTGITHHQDLDLSLADAGYDFIDDAFVSGRAADGRVPGGWDTGDWTTTEPWLSECTDSNNPPDASSWHGTHVSGTIAELTNNAEGMAGIAYGAKVLPIRVLGHCGGYTSDIADAIEWASRTIPMSRKSSAWAWAERSGAMPAARKPSPSAMP